MLLKNMLAFGCLFCMPVIYAQNKFNYQNIVPPSPEVAAIAKYTDIPVSYSSGVPQISIPIYSAASGSLQVPVSLSYNASGIRVEEAATWVGLGWNLNYGGSLSRVVRGMPDETDAQGYMKVPAYRTLAHLRYLPLNSVDKWNAFEEVEDRLDLEADIFNFSVMGYSGKFCYDQSLQKFVLMPLQNVKIDHDGALQWFILTLPNGVKCYFGNSADGLRQSHERTTMQYSTTWENGYATSTSSPSLQVSMWSLMDIVSPTGQSISFHYDHRMVSDFGRGSETKDFMSQGNGQPSWVHKAGFQYQRINKPFISKISTAQCDVLFMASTPRQDVFDFESPALDSIIVKNKKGLVIKTFVFTYDYFLSSDVTSLWGLEKFADVAKKRLKLKSVTEKGTVSLPPYEFSYNDVPLPNRLSASQDYWGFYNGKNNAIFLMPRWHTGGYTGLPEGYTGGANREIDTVLTQAALLTAVKYPTGGATRYYYEQNRASVMYYKSMGVFERPDLVDKKFVFPGLHPDDLNALYYSNTFKITTPGTKVKIKAQLDGCGLNYNMATCPHLITIKGISDPSFTYSFAMSTEFYLELADGVYEISNQIASGISPVPFFNVELSWREIPDQNNFLVGGVRIRKIVTADGDGSGISRSYSYDMGVNTSSGILYGCPVHVYNIPLDYYSQLDQAVGAGGNGGTIKEVVKAQPGDGVHPDHDLRYLTYTAQSAVPLTPDGQLVHYMMVTEYFDSTKSSYKNEYIYDNDWDYYTGFKNDVPLPHPLKDWRKTLRKKIVYEKYNGEYRVLSEEEYFYQPFDDTSYLSGMKCTYIPRVVPTNNPMEPNHLGDISYYKIATERYLLDSSVVTRHSYTNGYAAMSQGTKNFYNNLGLPKETVSRNSTGQTISSRVFYPSDYDASLTGPLVNKNLVELPVKQEQIIDGKVRSGIVMEYGPEGLPHTIYNYENASLVPAPAHNTAQIVPSHYKPEAFLSFSGGFLKQVYKTGLLPHEVIYEWDASSNSPIMELSRSVSGSYAYTSFEDGGQSVYWMGIDPSRVISGGVTGRSAYNKMDMITSTVIPSVAYVVTYWTTNNAPFGIPGSSGPATILRSFVKDGETWRCYQHVVTGEPEVALRGVGKIDELRLYPLKGQMRTFTYDALIGTTSVCDDNNRIAYYEYDGLGRLSLIRNQDRYIMKKFCYNYQGQQTECSEQYNLLPPPDPCSSCTGIDKMCINNACYTGTKVLFTSVRISSSSWKCTYVYEFMDGLYVSQPFEEIVSGFCPL